jgi:hypothetical protein
LLIFLGFLWEGFCASEKIGMLFLFVALPFLQGYQLFHNYFRPHEALNGKTPAEACGIQIEGKNKWKTLIQNASKR